MERLVSELSLSSSNHEEQGDAFVTVVSHFVEGNRDECLSLTTCEHECIQQLKEVCAYFDEKFEAGQPNKVLVTLRDFLASLSKALRDHRAKQRSMKQRRL